MSVAIPWARPDYSEYHPRQLPKYHQAYAFRTSSDYASSKPSGEYAANHLMPISPGSRYYGEIHIQGADQQMYPTKMLIDSGNDITIITRATADKLGFNPDYQGERFFVRGIAGGAQEFRKFKNIVKIGNTTPTYIRMGMAVKEESLSENLLGRLDIFDSGKFEVIYDEDSIEFREKHSTMHVDGEKGLAYADRKYARPIRPL